MEPDSEALHCPRPYQAQSARYQKHNSADAGRPETRLSYQLVHSLAPVRFIVLGRSRCECNVGEDRPGIEAVTVPGLREKLLRPPGIIRVERSGPIEVEAVDGREPQEAEEELVGLLDLLGGWTAAIVEDLRVRSPLVKDALDRLEQQASDLVR